MRWSELVAPLLGPIARSRRGIADTAISLAPQAMGAVTGLLGSVLLARGLGPDRLGEYALITSIAGFSALFSDMGIGGTALRYATLASRRGDTSGQFAVLRWAFRVRILLVGLLSGMALAALPGVTSHLWHVGHLSTLMRWSLLVGGFAALASVPLLYLQSQQRFRANAAVGAGQSLLSLLSLIAIWQLQLWSLPVLVAVSIATAAVTAFTVLLLVPGRTMFLRGEFARSAPWSIASWRRMLRPPQIAAAPGSDLPADGVGSFAMHMVAATAIALVTNRLDVWLMGALVEPGELGLYSAATKFTIPLAMMLGAMTTALWPRASGLQSLEAVRTMATRSLQLSGLVALFGLAYAVLAPLLAPWIFGAPFSRATPIAQLLCLRYCVAILACPSGVIGYSLGLVRVYWRINLVQLCLVLALDVVLLPRIGVIAAALALLAQDVLAASVIGVLVWRRVRAASAAGEILT